MTRFLLSTCGVLTEAATLHQLETMTTTAVLVSAAGVVLAVGMWWKDLQPQVDRWIGLDL